jgi:hypothetical protein
MVIPGGSSNTVNSSNINSTQLVQIGNAVFNSVGFNGMYKVSVVDDNGNNIFDINAVIHTTESGNKL